MADVDFLLVSVLLTIGTVDAETFLVICLLGSVATEVGVKAVKLATE